MKENNSKIFIMEKMISMNRIRELREDRDLRQIDVAQATGIDQKTLSNYETGRTNPDSYAIVRLADFFGVSCDYLLGVTARSVRDTDDVLRELEEIKARIATVERALKHG